MLVAVEGLRPSEAAEVCEITPEAMRQRLSRARALFSQRLTEAEQRGLTYLNELRHDIR